MVWHRRLAVLAVSAALLALAPLGGCKKEEPIATPGAGTDDSGGGSGMVKGQITKDQVDAAREKAGTFKAPTG